MSQPFKLRYQNEIVGAFLLGVVLAVMVAAMLLARGGADEEELVPYAVDFGEVGVGLMPEGLAVRLRSQRVGRVLDSEAREGGHMRVRIGLQPSLQGLLPIDSQVVLYTPMAGLAGETYLEISPGTAPIRAGVGDALTGRVAGDVLQLATDLLVELRGNVAPTLFALKRVSLRADAMLGRAENALGIAGGGTDTDAPAGADALVARALSAAERLERTLQRAESVLERLEGTLARVDRAVDGAHDTLAVGQRVLERVDRGEGLLGKVLRDPVLERRAQELLAAGHGLLTQVERAVGRSAGALEAAPEVLLEARRALGDVAAIAAELRRLAPAVPAMVGEIDALLGEGRAALDAASRHWLVGGALRPQGPPAPLAVTPLRDEPPLPDLQALRRALSPLASDLPPQPTPSASDRQGTKAGTPPGRRRP